LDQVRESAAVGAWPDVRPFGNGAPTGPLSYNLRFPGQFFDQNAKLHYDHSRDYDPNTGRYIESDPIGLRGRINTMRMCPMTPTRAHSIYFGERWSWFLGAGSVLRAGSGGGVGTIFTLARKAPPAAPDHHLRDSVLSDLHKQLGPF
jgi:RHS repeat-associated protein